jgi:AcrR family transcriptional regulator
MSRPVPEDRLQQLVERAAEVFIDQGYDRTQMADIARASGLAKGTLYLYVESKEALFDFVLRHADEERPAGGLTPPLPIPTPRAGATLRYVREELEREQRLPKVAEALTRRRVTDVAGEIAGIVCELFQALARNRRRIKLIDRSARDLPEIAALWYEGARAGYLALLEHYLRDRFKRGSVRAFPDAQAAARLIVETTAFWAIHRHWDPHPQSVSDEVAEAIVVQFVVAAFTGRTIPAPPPSRNRREP